MLIDLATRSAAVSSACRASISVRGVISSAAVRVPNRAGGEYDETHPGRAA